MTEQGFYIKNVKKLGVNSQSCNFYSSFKCVNIVKWQEGRLDELAYLTSLD